MSMQRVTVTIDADLIATIDELMKRKGYTTRSEIFRDLLRRGVAEEKPRAEPKSACLAVMTFVAEQKVRDLPQRIAKFQCDHHDMLRSQMQVQLDHDSALHTVVLQGPASAIKDASDAMLTQRGVRHGRLAVIPSRIETSSHNHGHGTHTHVHIST
jgi:CopG family transcriptional regulator, nickel-responsive regulator